MKNSKNSEKNNDLISSLFTGISKAIYSAQNSELKNLIVALLLFSMCIVLGTFLLATFGAITNYDSLTAHMARVMYYRQFGKIGYYGANYWAQDIHPYVLPFVHLMLLKISGWENSVNFVQWFSILITSAFSSLAIRNITDNRAISIITGCLSFFFVNTVIQASTTQNDLVLTALVAIQLWITTSGFSLKRKYIFLWLFFLLGLGIKQTFVLYQLPVLIVLVWNEQFQWKNLFQAVPAVTGFLLTLIAGPVFLYHMIDNYLNLGNPFGFRDVMESHSFWGRDWLFILKAGTRNLCRYGFDFFTLDGLNTYPFLSQMFLKANNFIKWNLAQLLKPLTGNLEVGNEIRVGFFYLKSFSIQDSSSFWGPIGPFLIFPSLLIATISFFRFRKLEPDFIFSICILVVFIFQAFSSNYDMWRGRYFNEAVPFASCLGGIIIHRFYLKKYAKIWILTALLFSGLASFGAVFFRHDATIIWSKKPLSVFSSSREELMTGKNPELIHAIEFVRALPADVDSIGLFTTENMPEYLLFDIEGNRKFFPMNSYGRPSPWKNTKVDAILFTDNVHTPKQGDMLISTFGINNEKIYFRRKN